MSEDTALYVGIDTGGTFTDVVARDASGALRVHKLLSTPSDPSRAIADGARHVQREREHLEIVHGTTVATNALLERKGGRVVFVTTAGFEDLLELRRQNRPRLYELEPTLPPGVVAAGMSVGVRERLRPTGDVALPLDDDEVEGAVERVAALNPDAVAICFLHAYANDAHEVRLAEAVRARLPGVHVTASSEIVREFREYERASTVAVNAFVGPVMSRYIASLASRLPEAKVEILQSSGGRTTMDHAARFPVHTVLSGPAGGVVGAVAAAAELGMARIITFDMGGTSTDVSLCDGEASLSYEAEIDGLPIRAPVLDIVTVGAGGGSIARVDAGGALRVGPQSAGADPGPACYGRGTLPTVTDAHLALGRLRHDRFLGGNMVLDVGRARDAVSVLAAELAMKPEALARGILAVADAAMVRAIKVVSVERGFDPREFALVSFGGAGGLHACGLADALAIETVVVPRHPGLLSAYGMLHADAQRLYSQSVLAVLEDGIVPRVARELRARADADLARAGRRDSLSLDLRYVGQSFEINLALSSDTVGAGEISRRFSEEHERLYGYQDRERPVELVAVRLRAAAPAIAAPEESPGPIATTASIAPVTTDLGETSLIERDALEALGEPVEGPAIVTEYSGTTVVLRGWQAVVENRHLVLRRSRA